MDAIAANLGEGADTLGTRIRRGRLLRFWSLDQLASRLGVSKVTIWNWESGRTRPQSRRLEQLSAVLDLSVNELLNGSETERSDWSAMVIDCQSRIAAAAGVPMEHVEITVRFKGARQ